MRHLFDKQLKAFEREIAANPLDIEPVLKKLIDIAPPQLIHKRSMYRRYLSILELCLRIAEEEIYSEEILKSVRNYAKMISLLIGDYEKKQFKLPNVSQADILRFLMEEHKLTQVDLKKELGGQPAVSNVLHGKRKLNARQIGKVSARFGISPAAFFPELANSA